MTDTIVFDTEPLVAYLDDEPGSDTVETCIDRVAAGEVDGYISPVTKTEIVYVGARVGFRRETLLDSLRRLADLGVPVYEAENCWETAATLKADHMMTLGDAYALATTRAVDGTLLVGADSDFTDVPVAVERFRDEPA
ncbi:MAG: putative nucleic acid-binding protein, contains PIN domain protein [Halonotius sp. J07HN6]|jgi:PIN domain.|nr:MAG: putative nucleic acid-binding protein, contains PIN domain protein [Halonotius sp. J07HN6]